VRSLQHFVLREDMGGILKGIDLIC
jgi:hypothetical protein